MRGIAGFVFVAFALGGAAQDYRYAEKVLPETRFVLDPENAVGESDGRFAGVELYNGVLELAVRVKAGEGADIGVIARRPQYGQLPETMNYAVLARPDKVETWTLLGWGTGKSSPEYFEMGKLESADRVQIVFREVNEIYRLGGIFRTHKEPYRMDIDAVFALH
ncbi:MAG: hypothetical protein FJY82_05820 [Candidatus Aminicenantes bacterium]|nr:hypothetical protein [Candidatus Aminicenantes bacterium]